MKNRCLQIRMEEGKNLQLVTGKAPGYRHSDRSVR
jgi:hypothetical protein